MPVFVRFSSVSCVMKPDLINELVPTVPREPTENTTILAFFWSLIIRCILESLNGVSMLLLKLLTNRAQMFADVRTCWNADSVRRVTGYELTGQAAEAGGFIHLINSGACCLDACGKAVDGNGMPAIKPFWDMDRKDIDACMESVEWCPSDLGYFRGGGYSSRFLTQAEMPMTMIRLNLVKGMGPVVQIAEGSTVDLPLQVADCIWKRTDYTWPCTFFAPRLTGKGAFRTVYDVMNNWGETTEPLHTAMWGST